MSFLSKVWELNKKTNPLFQPYELLTKTKPGKSVSDAVGGGVKTLKRNVGSPVQKHFIRPVYRNTLEPALETAETAYREIVSQPMSTAMLAGAEEFKNVPGPIKWNPVFASMLAAGGAVKQIASGDIDETYEKAEDFSPGQATVLLQAGIDPDDEQEVQKFLDSPVGRTLSGTYDAATRIFADPTVIGGKAVKAARGVQFLTVGGERAGVLARGLQTDDDIMRFMGSDQFSKLDDLVAGKTAAEIQHARPTLSPQAATLLEQAGDNHELRREVWKKLFGHTDSYDPIYKESVAVGNALKRSFAERQDFQRLIDQRIDPFLIDDYSFGGPLSQAHQQAMAADKVTAAHLQAELDELYGKGLNLDREFMAFGSVGDIPRAGKIKLLQARASRTDWYMKSPSFAARAVRKVGNMTPHNRLNVHRPDGHVQIQRMLRKSELSLEDQDRLVSDYMAAMDDAARTRVAVRAEESAVASIAAKNGMTKDEIVQILRESRRGRDESVSALLAGTEYTGNGRATINVLDETGQVVINEPLVEAQNANFLPLANMDEVKKAAERAGRVRADHADLSLAEIGEMVGKNKTIYDNFQPIASDVLDDFYKIWKPGVLLRPGWPIRVVTDLQLRAVGQFGSAAVMLAAKQGTKNVFRDVFTPEVKRALGKVGIGEGGTGRVPKAQRLPGPQEFTLPGTELKLPLPFDPQGQTRGAVSSAEDMKAHLGQLEDSFVQKAVGKSSGWRSDVHPTNPDVSVFEYKKSYERALNLQFGQSTLSRMFMAGKTGDDLIDAKNIPIEDKVYEWLNTSRQGQRLQRRIAPARRSNLKEHVQNVSDEVTVLTQGDDVLKAKALEGTAKYEDLAEVVKRGDGADFPVIHGEEVSNQLLREGNIWDIANGAKNILNQVLGQMPVDTLARNPMFAHVYQRDMIGRVTKMRRAALNSGRELTWDEVELAAKASKEKALLEIDDLFYNFQERSEFAQMTRHIMPFFPAFQEMVTRWGGIAVNNPSYIRQLNIAWGAPERAGFIIDENGNKVDGEGNATDADGNKVEAGSERYVRISVPDSVRPLLNIALPGEMPSEMNTIDINKNSINMLLQGTPGFGPPVQVPVNELVKKNPELEDVASFILPFGTSENSMDLFFPTIARRYNEATNENTYANQRNAAHILQAILVDIASGKREMPEGTPKQAQRALIKEAEKKAADFAKFAAGARYMAPFAMSFKSPYQYHMDIFKAAEQRYREDSSALADEGGNERTPDEWFLDEHPESFFALTQSTTRSNDGVAPTVEAFNNRKELRDLVEQYPEYGGWLTGRDGGGEFSGAAWDAQLSSRLKPGSKEKQREQLSLEEFFQESATREGWVKYRRVMELLNIEREERGLSSFDEELQSIRDTAIEDIAEEHPAWLDEYDKQDRGKMRRTISFFETAIKDPRIRGRQEAQGVAKYLEVRRIIQEELAARDEAGDPKTLSAQANSDLQAILTTAVDDIIDKYPAFSDTYYRYFERDDLEN